MFIISLSRRLKVSVFGIINLEVLNFQHVLEI